VPVKERVLEKRAVARIVRHLPRRPVVDVPADVTLADIGLPDGDLLAIATDGLSEEIATGLYCVPATIGWVLVMAAVSDLAAAGARLVGVATNLNLPREFGPSDRDRLARGIGDACRSLNTVTLGGDVNVAAQLTAAATAIGLVRRKRLLARRGARPGDAIYLSGPAGLGNAYALSRFDPARSPRRLRFRPRARIDFGPLLAGWASCCMDTSDAVLATLDELASVNRACFAITEDPAAFLHPHAAGQCRRRGLPGWLALAGCHGEFELAFTVPRAVERSFLRACRASRLRPVRIGEVRKGRGVTMEFGGRPVRLDTARLRNLAFEAAADVGGYMRALVEFAREVAVAGAGTGKARAPGRAAPKAGTRAGGR